MPEPSMKRSTNKRKSRRSRRTRKRRGGNLVFHSPILQKCRDDLQE